MGPLLNLAFWIFVLLIGLSLFGISLEAIINSPAGQANFSYLLSLLSQLWYVAVAYIGGLRTLGY